MPADPDTVQPDILRMTLWKVGISIFFIGASFTALSLVRAASGSWNLPVLIVGLILGIVGTIMLLRDPSLRATGISTMKLIGSTSELIGLCLLLYGAYYLTASLFDGAVPWNPHTGLFADSAFAIAVVCLVLGIWLWFRPIRKPGNEHK